MNIQLETTLELFDAALKEFQLIREKKDWALLNDAVKNLQRLSFRIYLMTEV